MGSAGRLYMEIIPSAKNFASMLSSATMSDAAKIGRNAGSEFSKGLSGGMSSGLAGAKSALKSASDAVSSAELSVLKSHNAVADGAEKLNLAEARLAATRQRFAEGSPQVLAAENRVSNARRATNVASTEATTAEGRLADAHVKQTAVQDASTKSSKGAMGGFTGVGLAVGAAAITIGVVAVKAAADYQTALTKLVTTAGESPADIKKVGDGMLAMAGQVGISAQDLAKGMYTVESAGFHAANGGLDVLKASAQGAKQEGAELGTVTNAVTDILTDYHLKAGDAANVTSKLVETTANGKMTFEQLASSMSTIAPIASAAGIKMNDMLGTLAEMTSHGVSADQATQNLASAVRSLANPTLVTTKNLAALGINSADLSKNLGTTGLAGSMEQVSQAVLAHMGPAGTTLQNAFNQSKQAASDANQMFQALPPSLKGLAKGMQDGSVSQHDWVQGLKNIDPIQANLLKQWLTMEKRSTGFSDALKTGGNASKTYTQAMAGATGGSASLNVALMTTKDNAGPTADKIKAIGSAAADASGNVKGWSDVQGNMNQKMDEAKAGFGALGITIGQALMPVVSTLAGWMAKLADWMSKHQTLSTIISVAFIVIAVAIGVATVAMIAFNSAVWSNPITWIVVAILLAVALLVAGIVLLVMHWKQIWGAISGFTKDACKAISGFVGDVSHAIVGFFTDAAHKVAAAFDWLWRVILQPVFNAISVAVRVVAAIFYILFVLPIVALIKYVLAPIFNWLYDKAIKPMIDAIGAVFHWLYDNAVKPVISWIQDRLRELGALFTWLHDHVFKPIGDKIGQVFSWLGNNIIKPFVEGAKQEWQKLTDAWNWLYDHVFKPIGDKIGGVFDGLKRGIDTACKGITDAWNGLMDILKVPVNFIINTIYTGGIKRLWDGVSGMFGLPKAPEVKGLAGGGVLPGYAPGRDSIAAMLSPGESVLTPEATRMLGAGNILKLNAMSGRRSGTHLTNGRLHADGGFLGTGIDFGAMMTGVKTALGIAGGPAGAVVGAVEGVSGFVSSINNVINQLAGMAGQNMGFVTEIMHAPQKIIESMIDKAKSWFSGSGGGGPSNQIPTADHQAILLAALAADGVQASGEWVNGLNTIITRESGWNANAVNRTDSNAQAGHPSQGLMQMIPGTFDANRNPAVPGGITDPVANIAAGIRYIISRYGSILNVQQANPNMPAKGYDSGGWLEPGGGMGVNMSSRPEPVFNSAQWDILKGNMGQSSGGHTFNYTATSHDPESVVAELERRQRSQLAQIN